MRAHRLYKSVWYWNEENKRLSNYGGLEREKTKQAGIQAHSSGHNLTEHQKPKGLFFTEGIDQNQQILFRQSFQRGIKPFIPHVVTMEDIKETIIFLTNGFVPNSFMELFCSNKMNQLFRALILYIQLYLKVWEDLEYRSASYGNQRLKHPVSVERETLCKRHLSKLRSIIGQEYALIIAGEGYYKKYHHMNNTLNRSYTDQDMVQYDYLSTFITRVVWTALNRTNFIEIETEIFRLFNFKDVKRGKIGIDPSNKAENKNDENILQGEENKQISKWYKKSPVISDIFINQDIPEVFLSKDETGCKLERTTITGLEAALKLPEELLSRFDLTVGVLGQPRDNFEPLLNVKQKQKSLEEEELDKLRLTLAEPVKPKIKMYEYLEELEATIDLENTDSTDGATDIIREINIYEKSHVEDSKRCYELWKKKVTSQNSMSFSY